MSVLLSLVVPTLSPARAVNINSTSVDTATATTITAASTVTTITAASTVTTTPSPQVVDTLNSSAVRENMLIDY